MVNAILLEKVSTLKPLQTAIVVHEVLDDLKQIFPFNRGSFIVAKSVEDVVLKAGLSERQRQRAEESLRRHKSFWDRIGNRIIIPVILPSVERAETGIVVIEGTSNRDMGPDEAERWIPLLSRLIKKDLLEKTVKKTFSEGEKLPEIIPYLVVKYFTDIAIDKVSVLRLSPASFKSKAVYNLFELLNDDRFLDILGRYDLAGVGEESIWVLLPGISSERLSSAVKKLSRAGLFKQKRVFKVVGTALEHCLNPEDVSQAIENTCKTADVLGASIFTSYDLEDLYKKFGIKDLPSTVDSLVGENRGKRFTVSVVSKECSMSASAISKKNREEDVYAFTLPLPSNRFSPPSSDWLKKNLLKEFLNLNDENIEKKLTAGIASTWQKNIGHKDVVVSAFWAHLHSKMLGGGGIIVHDDVTWQLRGDELSAWGDYLSAIRAYRKGLEEQPDNPDILNSLGVCLATTGRYSEAVSFFIKASGINPSDFMLFYNMAGALQKSGYSRKALGFADKALELSGDNTACIIRKSEILVDLGRYDYAVTLLEKIVNKDVESNFYVLRLMSKALMNLGEWYRAKKYLEKVIAENPGDIESLSLLSKGYRCFENDLATAIRLGCGRRG